MLYIISKQAVDVGTTTPCTGTGCTTAKPATTIKVDANKTTNLTNAKNLKVPRFNNYVPIVFSIYVTNFKI